MKHESLTRTVSLWCCALIGAASAQISVSVNPDTVFLGQEFTASGAGFTPNGVAVLHFAKPSGAELFPVNALVGAGGAYTKATSFVSSSENLPVGTYRHWAVDQSTGTRSADFFIAVTPARVFVIPRSTSNKIDADGNGYFNEATLQVLTFASSGFHSLDIKLYRRDCEEQESLISGLSGVRADYGPGATFGKRILANSQRELWDFRMDVFASGNPDSLVLQIPYGSATDWTSLPMWNSAPVCTSAALFPTVASEPLLNNPFAAYDSDTVSVEIRLAPSPQPISAFAFTVRVDSSRLAFVNALAGNLTSGFTIEAHEIPSGSGVIVCRGAATNAIPANSSGSVLRLRFRVQCAEGTLSEIALHDLRDDVAGLSVCCNAFVCAVCKQDGDLDHNAILTPGDALCAFQIYLNNGVQPASCNEPDFPCEKIAADVNCNGTVTPADALVIFQRYLQGLPPVACVGTGSLSRTPATPAQLTMHAQTSANTDDPAQFVVALAIEAAHGLTAFGARLFYPHEKLSFLGVRRGTLTATWANLAARELVTGEIMFGGFDHNSRSENAKGVVLEFLFSKSEEAISPDDFVLHEMVDDFRAAHVQREQQNQRLGVATSKAFQLRQNFPNPLRLASPGNETLIRFEIPGNSSMPVELTLYDLAGRIVRRLFAGEHAPGSYTVTWNGKDEYGAFVPSGAYWYRLQSGARVLSRALVVVR